MGNQPYGIDPAVSNLYAEEVKSAVQAGAGVAVVIGGGNIYRGIESEGAGIERATADYMGMLATMMNGMALQSVMEMHGIHTRLQSAIKMEQIAEPYIRRRAMRHLEKGRVVIFGAGTGNPFFTTDTAAALRAIEINADVLLKGTRVDGIYSADPEKDPLATRFHKLTFEECYSRNLNVMDMTAFTLCQEHNLPILVVDFWAEGDLFQAVQGNTQVGTLISN